MKKTFLIFLLFLFAVTFVSTAQESMKRKYHAFSGTLVIGAEAGVTLGSTDYSDIRPDIVGR